jgi:hypothetical protein
VEISDINISNVLIGKRMEVKLTFRKNKGGMLKQKMQKEEDPS